MALDPQIAALIDQHRVTADSREVQPGDLFFALAADHHDRERHFDQAKERGAHLLIAGQPSRNHLVHVVEEPRRHFALASLRMHGLDKNCPPLYGVTGTDGKTTVHWCLAHLLGPRAARIGTLGLVSGDQVLDHGYTTPPPEMSHPFLVALPQDTSGVAIELSSHALVQHRLDGLQLDGLVVTNVGRDHLDFHGSLDAYLSAKLQSVQLLRQGAPLVINADDAEAGRFQALGRGRQAQVIRLGMHAGSYRVQRSPQRGWRLHGPDLALDLPASIIGDFNAWNISAAWLLLRQAGVVEEGHLRERMATLRAPPGRLEVVCDHPTCIVDFAHTAQGLKRAIAAVQAYYQDREIIVAFGCGGNRDPGKRLHMMMEALQAHRVILTTDNPRSEDPQAIAEDCLVGASQGKSK